MENRCVVNESGEYVEYVEVQPSGETGELEAQWHEMKPGETLIEADPPWWTFESGEKATWTGGGWDPPEPAPSEPTPAELREAAYRSEKIVEWQGKSLTVDGAADLWTRYVAEGRDMAGLTALIAAAKETIRARCPD